ncbi:heat shock protein 9/12-domain-containing protein [Pyronema omphalodes]|nr:heat shock protein 9/12-domain-containing protein [Pyronema omphalodes]
MSDTGRKDFTSQMGDKLKPESQKSTTESIGDTMSSTYDRAAAAVVPDSQKSTTQKMGDSMRGSSDHAEDNGKGMVQSVADSISNAAQSAKEAITGRK